MTACDAVRELLAAHALCALQPTEATLVREHLEQCAACREADASARADVAALEAPPVAPPPMAWTRIRQRIAAQHAGDEPARHDDPGALIALSCSFCRGALVRAGSVYCASCLAPHHPDCWREYGRCSVMGCGEQRVVRPTERPERAPAPRPVDAGKDDGKGAKGGELIPFEDAARRRRRRWMGGGLAGVLVGGLAAGAALVRTGSDPRLAPFVVSSPPAPAVAEARWDMDVRDAALAEICAELDRVAGAKLDLRASVTSVLVRDARLRGRTWRELVREVAAEQGLVVREANGRLVLDERGAVLERAGSTVVEHSTQLFEVRPGGWSVDELRVGRECLVAVAQEARAIAIADHQLLRVRAAGHDVTFPMPAPIKRLAWSRVHPADGGLRLAVVSGATCAIVDVRDQAVPSIADRIALPANQGVRAIGWPLASPRPVLTLDSGALVGPTLPEPLAADAFVVPLGASWLLVAAPAARGWTLSAQRVDPRWADATADARPRGRGWSVELPGRPTVEVTATGVVVVAGSTLRVYTLEGALASQVDAAAPPEARSSASGEVMAWLANGRLTVRRPGAADAAVVPEGTADPIVGFSVQPAGSRVALWTATRLLLADLGGDGDVPATGVWDALESGDLVDAAWTGDALVIRSRREVRRADRMHVNVWPAGTTPDVPVEVEVGDAPDARQGSMFTPPPAVAEAAPTTEVAATTEPAATTAHAPDPRPVTPPASPAPAPAPPIPAAFAHVRAGQRYTFVGGMGELQTWEVMAVTPTHVLYRETYSFRGDVKQGGEERTFGLQRPERLVTPVPQREDRLTFNGVTFTCRVTHVGDVRTWTAVAGEYCAFPGRVRDERDGTIVRELIRVD